MSKIAGNRILSKFSSLPYIYDCCQVQTWYFRKTFVVSILSHLIDSHCYVIMVSDRIQIPKNWCYFIVIINQFLIVNLHLRGKQHNFNINYSTIVYKFELRRWNFIYWTKLKTPIITKNEINLETLLEPMLLIIKS